MGMHLRSDAFEILRGHEAPFLFTCEHASNRVPEPLTTAGADRRWLESHWGWDIGIPPMARSMLDRLGGSAVLARFSRLVCDPNRRPDAETLIRTHIYDEPLSFNQGLDDGERRRRLDQLHHRYHGAVDAEAARLAPTDPLLLSLHSFTPSLDGDIRPMEIGVLFHEWEPQARDLRDRLASAGFSVALNEPYSGVGGLIYAIRRHGLQHRRVFLELEVRQDLLTDDARARQVGARIAEAMAGWSWRATP